MLDTLWWSRQVSQGNKEKMIITSEALSPCSSLIRYIECQEYFSSTHFRLDAFSRLIPRKYKVCLVEFRTLNWHNFSSLPQSTESNLAKCANAKDNTVHWLVLCTVYLQCCQSGIKIHKVHLYRRSLGHPNCITNTRWFHHFINDLCRRWIWKTIWMIRSCLKMEKKYFWWVEL